MTLTDQGRDYIANSEAWGMWLESWLPADVIAAANARQPLREPTRADRQHRDRVQAEERRARAARSI